MAIRASSRRHRGCSIAPHAIHMVVAIAIAAVAAVAVDVVSVILGPRRCRCRRRGLAALGGVRRERGLQEDTRRARCASLVMHRAIAERVGRLRTE